MLSLRYFVRSYRVPGLRFQMEWLSSRSLSITMDRLMRDAYSLMPQALLFTVLCHRIWQPTRGCATHCSWYSNWTTSSCFDGNRSMPKLVMCVQVAKELTMSSINCGFPNLKSVKIMQTTRQCTLSSVRERNPCFCRAQCPFHHCAWRWCSVYRNITSASIKLHRWTNDFARS